LVTQFDPLAQVVAPSGRDLDLTDADAIVRTIRTCAPDLIINTAACGVMPDADPDMALSLYSHAPRVLAEEAERLAVPFVHYSTDRLFDGTKKTPYVYAEEEHPSPRDVVGRAQLLGERAVLGSGAPFLLLRVAWVYGLGDLTSERVFGDAPSVWAAQTGSPTWGRHVAAATLRMLEALVDSREFERDRLASALSEQGGVFHVAAEGQTDERGFIDAVARLSADDERGAHWVHEKVEGLEEPSSPAAGPKAPRRNRQLDTSKLARELGIRLPTWEAGLLESWTELAAQRMALTA